MPIELTKDFFAQYEDRMERALKHLQEELVHVRVGRADARLLDRITVNYYDTETPINQVATVQVSEARQLMITPWDASVLKEIEKSILASDLGITPQSDGKAIRLNFPMLTEDRRRELGKQVQKLGEESKVAIRGVRRDFLDDVKALLKKSEISEDRYRGAEDEIQKMTDKSIEKIDHMVKAKEKDLLEI